MSDKDVRQLARDFFGDFFSVMNELMGDAEERIAKEDEIGRYNKEWKDGVPIENMLHPDPEKMLRMAGIDEKSAKSSGESLEDMYFRDRARQFVTVLGILKRSDMSHSEAVETARLIIQQDPRHTWENVR